MARYASRLLLIVTLVLVDAESARALRAPDVVGCWQIQFGAWRPSPGGDSLLYEMPTWIRLSADTTSGYFLAARRPKRPPTELPELDSLRAYWKSLPQDSIELWLPVWWSTGVRARLVHRGDSLRGVASIYVDVSPSNTPRADVTAHRVTCSAPPNGRASQIEASVAKYMAARARVTDFNGAVLVAREGRVVFRGGFGAANREFSVRNAPGTKFRIGSVSKQFTAAAVLLLAQRGLLRVSDPIGKYLPEWPAAWSKVTIHHLLSHTAGLPRLTTRAMLDVSGLSASTPAPFRTVSDLFVAGEELQPLDHEPGEGWAYSNVGYIALGMLVAKVSGQSFCDFVSQALFQPLAMTNSGCEGPSVIVANRASGYNRIGGTLTSAPYVDVGLTGGAGAFYSTVDDLLRWDRALTAHKLLDASSTASLFTAVRNEYGYGWWIQTKFNRRVEWHGGNAPGLVSQITRYPNERLFVAVLSNAWSATDRSQVRAMSNELAALMLGEPYELPRQHVQQTLTRATYDDYVGEYRRGDKDAFAIAREGERLFVQIPPGNSVFEIVPESATQFFWKDREYYLTFERKAGRVTGISIRNEGELARWTKVPVAQ